MLRYKFRKTILLQLQKEGNEVTDNVHIITDDSGNKGGVVRETASTGQIVDESSASFLIPHNSCELFLCLQMTVLDVERPKPNYNNRISRKIRYKKF